MSEVKIVAAWHDALNTGNLTELLGLVHQHVTIGGANGMVQGVAAVQEWFGRANARFYPLRYFAHGKTVIVEQEGHWYAPQTGELISKQMLATIFVVDKRLIISIMRHEDLSSALNEAGLALSDEVHLKRDIDA